MEQQQKVNIEVVSIDELIQDDRNFNKGSEQGAQLLERSFRECGAGRSVLIDKDNRLVEGIWAFPTNGKRRKPKGKTNTNYHEFTRIIKELWN